MNPRAMLRATVVVGGLTALAVTGCATGSDMPKMTAEQAIDKAKAGHVAVIAPDAQKLATTAKEIPALFPEGSLAPDKSAAKPEIWQKRAEFDAAAKNLETWSVRLRDASAANNTEQTQAIMKDFGRQACGTCHTPFRQPQQQ